jgi:prevent-host-death family protein
MKSVNVHEAKTTLSALLAAVESGEEITIARHGVPVARLVPIARAAEREPGLLCNAPGWDNFVFDPATFAPMTDAELENEGWE